MVKRDQYMILETYIRRLIEADLGSRLKDSKETAWKNATLALRDYLQRLKIIQELRKQANDNNPSDPQQAEKDLDKLRRGGKYDSSGKIVGVKTSSPIQFNLPTTSLKTVIEAWKSAAREWNEFDPIEVDEEYSTKQDSILALYQSIPYIKDFAKKQKITNEDDPFREAFENPAPQSVVSKGERPSIPEGQWIAWTKNIDSKDEEGNLVKGIPFERSELDYKIKAGPGERLLAAELGANGPMGSGVSYDIEWNGFKYEVKAISEGNYTIRAASEGIKLFSKISKIINDIFIQIKIFTEKYKQFFGNDAFTRQVNTFFAEEEEKFESGGVSEERIRKLSAVIQSVSRRIKSLGGVPGSPAKKKISVNDKDYEVSGRTYQTILDLLGVKAENLDNDQKVEFLSSILKSDAFVDVDKFIQDLNYDLRPSQMFSGIVDGLFIVHPKGYYYVDISDIDNKFKFVSISQGRPEYKFIG
jgi:hypothetical protein